MAEHADGGRSRPDDGPSLLPLYLILFVLYLFTSKGYLQASDTMYSVQTAESLVTRGWPDIPHGESYTFRSQDGRSYSKYGIGLPLYYVPWVAAARALHRVTGLPAAELTGLLISLANLPFAMLLLWLFARLLRAFGADRAVVGLLVVALGCGTLCWKYAVSDFSEEMQAALLLLAYAGVTRPTRGGAILGGFALAALALVKLVHLALLPAFVAYLIVRPVGPRGRRIGDAIALLLPVLLALGVVAGANALRFGNPLESGYGREAGGFHPSQLWWTLPSLLFSPDKGLFVFCPVLVLGAFGWWPFARRFPHEAALCGLLVVANLVLAGAWHSWVGGWSWGPRLLVPAIPLWLLPAGSCLDPRAGLRFAAAALLTAASALWQVPGVLIKEHQILHMKFDQFTPAERRSAPPDPLMACQLLRHKLTAADGSEVYRLSEFGVPGDRVVDVGRYRTFVGLNVVSEHFYRHFRRPLIRWTPIFGLIVIGYGLIRLRPRSRRGPDGRSDDPAGRVASSTEPAPTDGPAGV